MFEVKIQKPTMLEEKLREKDEKSAMEVWR